jgi:hypothetical protein
VALRRWYADVRSQFLNPVILQAALAVLNGALAERVSRLKGLAEKMPESVKGLKSLGRAGVEKVIRQEKEFHAAWPRIEDLLGGLTESYDQGENREKKGGGAAGQSPGGEKLRDGFLQQLIKITGKDYVSCIQALDAEAKQKGTRWLSSIVGSVEETALSFLPSFKA